MGRIRRGEIVIANLEPVRGSEQGGIRPVLILQNDSGNFHSPTTIVAAITSRQNSKNYPINIEISKRDSRLPKDSVILLNQIRTIDKSRIQKRISKLNPYLMFQVDTAMKISLGLE